MTAIQIASLFNLTAIALIMAVSIVVRNRYPRAYFHYWIIGHLGGLALVGSDLIASFQGRSVGLAALNIAAFNHCGWFFIQTGLSLQGRYLPRALYLLGLLLFLPIGIGMLLNGATFDQAILLPALYLTAAFVWMGGSLINLGRRGKIPGRATWLGFPVLLLGALPFIYPIVLNARFVWMGYWLSGLLNLLVGIGMVVALLEDAVSELHRKNQELQELDRLKSNFLDTVSHELRTPLSAIKGSTWILKEDLKESLDESLETHLSSIAAYTDHLSRLVNNILDLSRINSGNMKFNRENTELGELIADVTSDHAYLFEAKNIELSLNIPNNPVTAIVDKERLVIAFSNLLINAAKFTPNGKRVWVRLYIQDQARIEFEDEGIGVPEEYSEKIFEKFVQVDSGTTREFSGTGLGLAICKSIIEEGHSGKVWVERSSGGGSKFIICLPIYNDRPVATVVNTSK